MRRNLDITLLRTFVCVADHSGMTAAANALHLTQSAVSQQVARLEELSGELFIRNSRRLRLSANGERLLAKARQMVALNDALWSEMSAGQVAGQVRLGVPYDLTGEWLTTLLRQFADDYPGVDIRLVCLSSPELRSAIDSATLDIALIEEPTGQVAVECLKIDSLVWVGARGGNACMKNPLPVSMVADTCAFRPVVLTALENSGLTWRTLSENGSIDATRATVRADLAVTVWLRTTVPADLVILSETETLPALPAFAINLYRSAKQPAAAAEALTTKIRQHFSTS
ncbi:LysR substrate-binding domain-containing protein [Tatumella citrea]|uniref:LysR family transcriptional regulator n=1 Tax=Tatumella citrea TaxID=53336 RepID=A0A1Y0L7E8_TATCI|nr:LysR substrate-binding domain-containing protein [Tatumella citrea]ARU93956.1 LysR family transcriptional regulator [Tatumella citrea]ARU97994.1 LysR family transcriptional regulator [Tatumella citrea]